ncbi:VP3 [Bercke-Baary Melophagus reo-like virus]|nr:VP3 [Bercke-Baary Melophagus reo-like virus]UJG27947.1 VP3 [Bercke-Baary Melophagus reo-like virus]
MTDNLNEQLQQYKKKINYLLTKPEQNQQTKQFSDKEISQLKDIIVFFSDLANEGVSKEELFEQLRYLADINIFKQVQSDLNERYTSMQNGVHANIYTFNFRNYNRFNDLVFYADPIDLPTNINDVFKEGYIVIQCTPNLMLSTQSNILLNVSSTVNSVKLILGINNVECIISQKEFGSISITGDFDRLIGSETRNVPNKQFYLLKYICDASAVVNLQFCYMSVNVSNKNVSINLSAPVQVGKLQFDSFINDLPPRITIMAFGAESVFGNEVVTVENLFITNRLKTLENDLYSTFQLEFSNSNVNSLYGQSAAVGISQLYNSLGSTVRQLSGEYSLDDVTDNYIGIDVPDYFDVFAVNEKNQFDIFGNSFPIVFSKVLSEDPPLSGSFVLYTGLRLKLNDYPYYNLLNEVGGRYVTNSTLGKTRFTIKKSKIKQILSDGTTEMLDCWIEGNTSDKGLVNNSIKGTWVNVNGTILDAQLDADFNNSDRYKNGMKIDIEGFQISVHDPDNLIINGKTYKVMHGYKHTHQVSSQVRFVINVSNASQDGIVSQNVDIQLTVDGELRSITVPLEKQRIAYGDGEIMAYIATIDTITENVVYYTGAVFQVDFVTSNPYPFYASRSPYNIPINYYYNDTTAALIKYTGNDYFIATNFGKDGQYISVDPIGTGAGRPYVFTLRRGIVAGAINPSRPVLGMVVPYLKPIINNLETTYNIPTNELKMAYISLVSNPRVENFTIGGNAKITIEAIVDMKVDSTNKFKPLTYFTGDMSTFDTFVEYSDLSITRLNLQTTLETWIDGDRVELPDYIINTFSVTIDDIFLPNAILSQINLSETIVQLQTAVQFLKYYATYLETLINNLDQRVIYVEESLKKIVDYLNTLNQKSQSPLGFAGNLVTFLGTGIGMFFPLIGLSVSLLGGILTSVDKIEQGDVVMGSIDLVVGGIMGVLGLYKYNKRLRDKYGEAEMPKQPIVNSENVMIKPGYIIINNDPPPMYYSGRRKNGVFRNTNLTTSSENGVNTTVSTTRINRQTTLWENIVWTDNPIYKSPRSIAFQGVYRETIKGNNTRSVNIVKEYKYVMNRINPDGTIEERILTNDEFTLYLDVKSTPEDYVKLELLYTQIPKSYNTNVGMDDETNVCLMAANGYLPILETDTSLKLRTIQIRPLKWTIQHSNKYQYKLNGKSNKEVFKKAYGPKLGLEGLYDAINPYRQTESSQIELYQNCISEIGLVNLKV